MVARNPRRRKSSAVFRVVLVQSCRGEPAGRGIAASGLLHGLTLGTPGGTGTAHVVQFGPVGIERRDHELTPERDELAEQPGTGTFGHGRRDGGIDTGAWIKGPLVIRHGVCLCSCRRGTRAADREQERLNRTSAAWSALIKMRYSALIGPQQSPSAFPNRYLAVALWGPPRYINSNDFPPHGSAFQGSRWRASSSTSCRV